MSFLGAPGGTAYLRCEEDQALMTAVLTAQDAKQQAAERVKGLSDVRLPRLDLWAYQQVCAAHARQGATVPVPDCEYQSCGGDLWGFQRVGVAWMYLRGSGLLADDPGLGKWVMALHLVCLLKQRGELPRRALFVVQTPSLSQCVAQTHRWAPNLRVESVTGKMTKAKRISRYVSGGWDMLIVGHHVARNDCKQLMQLTPFSLFFADDVDELLNERNVTHRALVNLASRSERSVVANATSLQTRLEQLHRASLACGGHSVFGTPSQFDREYVKRERKRIWVGRGVQRDVWSVTGYQRLEEFREKFLPLYLRRRVEDLHGVDMPTLLPPNEVYLELSAAQTVLYDKLRAGALKLTKADGTTYNAASTVFQSGQRICAGIPALNGPDGPGMSPKLDWLLARATGVWADRKIVAYAINRGMVEAAAKRCKDQGVGYAMVWGQQGAEERQAEVERFQRDPDCRMLIGSKSAERSLNLQSASILVAVDTQLNPARVRQLIGRIRRVGSRHQHVQVFTLLMAGTQEEKYSEVLRKRAGLSDFVFSEDVGEAIWGKLSAFELLEMITG